MARSGDLAGAMRKVQALQELRSTLEESNQSYWADRTEEQALAVSAWVAYAEGAHDKATKLMRAAVDGEDGSVKHMAMENRLYPMRELLGELLIQIGQAAASLGEFEAQPLEIPVSRSGSNPPGSPPNTIRLTMRLRRMCRPSGTSCHTFPRSPLPCNKGASRPSKW